MKPTVLFNACWAGAAEPKQHAEIIQGFVSARPDTLFVDFPAIETSLPDTPASEGIALAGETDFQIASALDLLEKTAPQEVLNIGCDCGTDFAPISYMLSRHGGKLCVIWFDAHADLNTPETSPSGHFHGMVLRALTGDAPRSIATYLGQPLDPRNIILAGVRDLDAPERAYIPRHDVTMLDAVGFTVSRYEETLHGLAKTGITHAYIHVDLDVLDPKEFPWVGCPTPGGLSVDHLANALEITRRIFKIAGMSAVEISSPAENLPRIKDILVRLGFAVEAHLDEKTSP